MKVIFRTNLGSGEAKRLNLDHTKCTVGKTVDVNKDVADELVKSGIAETTDKAEDDAIVQSAIEEEQRQKEVVKAVAKEPSLKAPSPEDFNKPPRAHDK